MGQSRDKVGSVPNQKNRANPAWEQPAILLMVFASGFAGLVYQVLWLRQMSLLFGSTAHAAAATLAAFFIGLGVGSWWWGRRVSASNRPMRLYAGLEFGIALAALIYFALLKGFYVIYPSIYVWVGGSDSMLGIKCLLALGLVFPAAFCMGGTVPAVGQVMIRERSRFGRTAALLYGVNTLGAALGILCAAFIWIPSFGFRLSYVFAVLLTCAVGVVALKLSRRESSPALLEEDVTADETAVEQLPRSGRFALGALCFFSGFVVLALEVVWMRIFAQVHENSVYSFAIILALVLICLAIGAGVSSVLSRKCSRPMAVLSILTLTGGCLLMLGPWLIMQATNQLQPVQSLDAWGTYVRGLLKMGFGGIGLVTIALGTVFPFLMKLAEGDVRVPGRMMGRLLAVNTLGAILGSLIAGFILLPSWGIWGSFRFLTAAYLVVSMLLPVGWGRLGLVCRGISLGALVLLFTVFDPTSYPVTGTAPRMESAKVLEIYEGSDCTVSVLENSNGHRNITINSAYGLGSTSAYIEQANQSRIPLHLYPETRSICYIGLGTGMSAGAAFDDRFPNVERVVSCELTANVVEASKEWIPSAMTGGLFTDPRSTVLIEDGRQYLMASEERFDMINADLFLPYRQGTGSLYSLDHYSTVAESLNPEGVFVQWLPLYQITSYEFGVIVRTMQEVFGQVTMWRNNFAPGSEKVALVAQVNPSPIPFSPRGDDKGMRDAVRGLEWWQTTPDMVRVEAESMPFFYAGNLSEAKALFRFYPVNTDDRPVIEYQTPKRFREVAAREEVIWCVGPKLIAWIDRVFKACPIDEDPALSEHSPASRELVRAGIAFHRAMVGKALDDRDEVEKSWQEFKRRWLLAAE